MRLVVGFECYFIVCQKISGEIIDTRAACDKSGDFIDGFVDGFTSKYSGAVDSVRVLCK